MSGPGGHRCHLPPSLCFSKRLREKLLSTCSIHGPPVDRRHSPAANPLGTVSCSSGNVTARRHPSSCSAVYHSSWAASPRAAAAGASAGCSSGRCPHRWSPLIDLGHRRRRGVTAAGDLNRRRCTLTSCCFPSGRRSTDMSPRQVVATRSLTLTGVRWTVPTGGSQAWRRNGDHLRWSGCLLSTADSIFTCVGYWQSNAVTVGRTLNGVIVGLTLVTDGVGIVAGSACDVARTATIINTAACFAIAARSVPLPLPRCGLPAIGNFVLILCLFLSPFVCSERLFNWGNSPSLNSHPGAVVDCSLSFDCHPLINLNSFSVNHSIFAADLTLSNTFSTTLFTFSLTFPPKLFDTSTPFLLIWGGWCTQ